MPNGFLRRAAPWACAWILGTQAANAAPPEDELADPFDRYQAWRDTPPLDWRAANERVGEIGGWRTYLREAQPGGDTADDGDQAQHDHRGH